MMLLVLAAIWLVGFGLLRGLFPQRLQWSLHNVLLFSLGIGAGTGIASCLYFLALVTAGPSYTVLASAIGLALAIALALGFRAKNDGTLLDWAEGPAVPWYFTALLAVAGALSVAMFLGAIAYSPHGEEGAWSIWNLRARFLFRAGPYWRDAFSSDLAWSHLEYPLLVPGLVALCWKLAGRDSTDAPIAIAFLYSFGTAGVLAGVLGVLRGRAQALLAGTLLLSTGTFIALGAALYGDVPLAFYILATLGLICLQDRHPEHLRFSAVAGLMAGFAAWTRNEGMIFVVAVIVARVIAMVKLRRSALLVSQLLRFLLGLAAPFALVIFFKLRVGGPSDLFSVPASSILRHLSDPGRWITTFQGLIVMLFQFGRFLIPIVLALTLYWYLVRFQVDARDGPALATGGIALGLTLLAQLLIDIAFVDNLGAEVSTSFERVLLQLWPAALLLFFLASGPLQLGATDKNVQKGKLAKKAPKPARGVPATR
jgi:hypothetical protein